MDIIHELRSIVKKIDGGESLGTYEAGMLEVAINRLGRVNKPTYHPSPTVQKVLDLFPGRKVATCGPRENPGVFFLTGVCPTTAKVNGEFLEYVEFVFDWDNPL